MKKMMIALIAMLTIAASGKAMSYEQARNEALFLTDKMAYELNLTDEQYEAAYEINLDYLMGVTSYDDVYGSYWERRNLDMSYVLLDWQWSTFCAATYFYRPLYWHGGYWHFGIYARYPHRDYFYFGRPVFYASYRGGHAWHVVGGRGWYYSRRTYFHTSCRTRSGMLDRWNRGDFHNSSRYVSSRRGNFGGMRNSSTRTTVNRNNMGSQASGNNSYRNGSFHNGSSRSNGNFGSEGTTSRGSFGNTTRSNSYGNRGSYSRNSYANNGSNSVSSRSYASNNGSSRSYGSYSGSSRNHGSFGSGRSSHSSGSFSGGTRSSGSFSGGTTRSSASFGGSRSGGSQSSSHSGRGGSFSRGR